jgi:hypothetical protein
MGCPNIAIGGFATGAGAGATLGTVSALPAFCGSSALEMLLGGLVGRSLGISLGALLGGLLPAVGRDNFFVIIKLLC